MNSGLFSRWNLMNETSHSLSYYIFTRVTSVPRFCQDAFSTINDMSNNTRCRKASLSSRLDRHFVTVHDRHVMKDNNSAYHIWISDPSYGIFRLSRTNHANTLDYTIIDEIYAFAHIAKVWYYIILRAVMIIVTQ